jgi:uncharacterized protein DUF6894
VARPRYLRHWIPRMPTFYISFRRREQSSNKTVLAKDDVGIDLPGLKEAKTLASAFACDLFLHDINSASDSPFEAVIVTNPEGQELMTILTADILPKSILH